MPRLRRATALVALLAYLALSTVGASWVLCYESDGHVAVEALNTGCCGDEDPAQDPDGDSDEDHDDDKDCGDCLDLLLSEMLLSREAADDADDVADVPALALIPDALASTWVAQPLRVVPRGPPRPPPQLAHLRTTHLLL